MMTPGVRPFGWRADDRGSLPMLMLVVLVGMALAALMIPLVITQTHTTTFDTGRVRALQAAESGIDVALGQVRAATTDGEGDASKLPCGPLSGDVDTGTGSTYRVQISYYTGDPNAHDADWVVQHAMICVSGYGVRDVSTDSYTPSFVLLVSTGTDPTTGDARTLQATYVVKTTNTNIPGGPIRVWPSGSTNYCMDAGSSPAVGGPVTLSACPTGNQDLPSGMTFVYNSDLTIQLPSTVGDLTLNANGYGLCLSTTGNTGSGITLAKCSAPGQPSWTQVWSIDDSSHLESSNSGMTDVSGNCIAVSDQSTGTQLKLQGCAGGTTDTAQTWVPSPAVGAGGAGATNSQLVNFYQFGRCLDVTNQSVATTGDAGGVFLILYTCKQNPSPKNVAWNQKFDPSPDVTAGAAPSQSQWITVCPGDGTHCTKTTNYCLTSPGKVGGYVTVTPCASSGDAKQAQTWTTYQTQNASGNELAYSDKYTIRDQNNLCLSLSANTDLYNNTYYKAVLATCDGSTSEKWNAQANVQTPVLEDLHEK